MLRNAEKCITNTYGSIALAEGSIGGCKFSKKKRYVTLERSPMKFKD